MNFRELVERSEKNANDHYESKLDTIHYFDSTTNKGAFALVLYWWENLAGSSSQGSVALVFQLSAGRLNAVQKIDWDTHFDAGGPKHTFDPGANTLTIRAAHYIPGDARCCVSAMDVVTFRWDGRRFAQSGIQTELSEYGKREGKRLPKVVARGR